MLETNRPDRKGVSAAGGTEMVLRAADAGSFTKAAASFDLAPSQASRAIAALEREIKATLFYRTTWQLRLTPEGHEFCHRSRELIDQLAELENSAAAAASRARRSRTLRVGISVPVSRLVIMPQLPEFTRKHPDLALEFVVLFHPKDLHAEGLDLLLRVRAKKTSGAGRRRRSQPPQPATRRRGSRPRAASYLKREREQKQPRPRFCFSCA